MLDEPMPDEPMPDEPMPNEPMPNEPMPNDRIRGDRVPDDDPLAGLDRELRDRVGGEFRRNAEDEEYAARKAALRGRRLADVAHELLNRGDTVVVACGPARFMGRLSHAAGSLLSVVTAGSGEAHVNLEGPVTIHVVDRATAGGRSRDRYGAESFIAKLRELELEAEPVELIVPATGDTPTGRLEAVAADHVMVRDEDGTDWYVPIGEIAAVVRR